MVCFLEEVFINVKENKAVLDIVFFSLFQCIEMKNKWEKADICFAVLVLY